MISLILGIKEQISEGFRGLHRISSELQGLYRGFLCHFEAYKGSSVRLQRDEPDFRLVSGSFRIIPRHFSRLSGG